MSKGILLFTKDIESARTEINTLGGVITQQFTSIAFVANLPDSIDPGSLNESTPDEPGTMDPVSRLSVGAWKGSQQETLSGAPSKTEGISWDTPGYIAPNHPNEDEDEDGDEEDEDEDEDGEAIPLASSQLASPQRSTGTPTSLYMTGSIVVGVVIVSGTESGLVFSESEQQKVIQEVQEALGFLANAEPRADLSFVYDIQLISVSVAPGSVDSYESAEGPWRNAALQSMGYSANRQGSRDYVQDLQQSRGTNWAYVAYFTKYPLRHFAYAVSEKLVMHYENGGWGEDNINRVFAHETCHIFGAADEYGSCACDSIHGYLGVANRNCRNCSGTQESCLMDSNVLQICEWSRGQIGWDESLFPNIFQPLSPGIYTLQQKSSNRLMDAHESSSRDFSVVTRTAQDNNTQRWSFTPVGTVYTIQQSSNGRFMDAHTSSANDFSVVTRAAQNNDSQRWVVIGSAGEPSSYTIQQLSNGRFVDAFESRSNDFSVVTRTAQNNNTQKWILDPLGDNAFNLQHLVNGRFLDAYQSSSNDFSVVTRLAQNNDTQGWVLTPVGGVYTIQQQSNGRFLDAFESSLSDFSAVTRTAQNNSTQQWVILAQGNDTYTIQQRSNGRFLDAHESSSADYSAVTRGSQTNDSQRWIVRPL